MSNRNLELKKVLLVASQGCGHVRDVLVRAGCRVVKADDGVAAVERAKHEALRAVVLISTGSEMDLTETVLNLRDIHPLVEIIIVPDRKAVEEAAQADVVLRAIPKTKILSQSEFNSYLASSQWARSWERA
jgi:DNA-binding NtrC family response regulator